MDAEVVVVGAGPVGLMLAGELRLGGATVVVLERLPAPTTESRASTLHARTMEIFDQRGLLDRFGRPPQRSMGHFGGVPLDFGAQATRFPGLWTVPQTSVEAVLGQWATGLGAHVRRGYEVVDVQADCDRVRVSARFAGEAGNRELTASYVVGCDGEDSTVRRQAGIALSGIEATRVLLRADVTGVQVADRRFERLPRGLAIAGRLPSGATRLMVSEFAAPAGGSGPVTFEELTQVWQRVTGEDISDGTPLWLNAFNDANLLAERYRAGRVLLAGDAAHRQMPSGGQAINLGLQDAVNLGWKLAAELSGRAPEGLLDTYHQERHATGRRVLANIAAQSALLLGADVEPLRTLLAELIERPEVRDLLASVISGLDVRYGSGEHPLVGARMPDVELATGSGNTSTTTLLRAGHGLILDLSMDAHRRVRLGRLAGGCAIRVDLSSPTPPVAGPLDGLDTVVLRPDGHVAWVSSRLEDPESALRRWFG
jgi:2-polyprenyl-6-methoxyphenol hydroxylase-like FAD-dependent oxidoreductase